jgi:hypothetical protein
MTTIGSPVLPTIASFMMETGNEHLWGFRAREGLLVPFVELDLSWPAGPQLGKPPIREIVTGPLLDRELAEESTYMILRREGYGGVIVGHSAAPLRP